MHSGGYSASPESAALGGSAAGGGGGGSFSASASGFAGHGAGSPAYSAVAAAAAAAAASAKADPMAGVSRAGSGAYPSSAPSAAPSFASLGAPSDSRSGSMSAVPPPMPSRDEEVSDGSGRTALEMFDSVVLTLARDDDLLEVLFADEELTKSVVRRKMAAMGYPSVDDEQLSATLADLRRAVPLLQQLIMEQSEVMSHAGAAGARVARAPATMPTAPLYGDGPAWGAPAPARPFAPAVPATGARVAAPAPAPAPARPPEDDEGDLYS